MTLFATAVLRACCWRLRWRRSCWAAPAATPESCQVLCGSMGRRAEASACYETLSRSSDRLSARGGVLGTGAV